jgi:hypothetical protein
LRPRSRTSAVPSAAAGTAAQTLAEAGARGAQVSPARIAGRPRAVRPECAMRRTAVEPAKRAGMRGNISGPDALPEPERVNGTAAWQKTGNRVQVLGTVFRGVRAIR